MEMDRIKEILGNNKLLNWVRQHSAEGLQDEKKTKQSMDNLNLSSKGNSLSITSEDNITMMVTNSKFNGKRHLKLNLEVIANIIKVTGKTGRLVVSDKKDNPAFIEYDTEGRTDLVVLAPMVSEDEEDFADKKKKKTAKQELEETDEEGEEEE